MRLSGDLVRIVSAVFLRPCGMAGARSRLAIEAGQDVLDRCGREQPIDGRTDVRVTSPLAGGSAKAASTASTGTAPHKRIAQIGEAVRAHVMRGRAGRDAVGGSEPLAGQRQIGADLARQRGSAQVAPTSGKNPMPTSGIAN